MYQYNIENKFKYRSIEHSLMSIQQLPLDPFFKKQLFLYTFFCKYVVVVVEVVFFIYKKH